MRAASCSRRTFAAALLAAPAFLRARPASDHARIKIDLDRTIGAIDPLIFGNFIEHLGRCIEGGVFQENSPLSNASGYRRDVMEAVRNLHVSLLRWPGGNFSSNYHWMDGIGSRDARPGRLELAWGTVEDNRFGTHEFLDYVEQLGIEPYVCANLGTGSWVEAQQWVEYCNHPEGTAMTRLREKNGRRQPWKVTYWGLGNEMDGPWQMGHRTADDYGKFALEAAKVMKLTDKNIKLIAAGSSNYSADWVGWNRTVLTHLRDQVDYLSMHLYVGNRDSNYAEFVASPQRLGQLTKTAEGIIGEVLSGAPRQRKIYLAWDEWNVWYRARGEGKEAGRRILEERYNLEDALVVAGFLNTFINHAHIVKIANMAQLVNVIAPIFTNDKGLFLQTIYYPLQLFATSCRGNALELWVDGPTYETKQYGPAPYVDVSATEDNGRVTINLVNRHESRAIPVDVEAQDAEFAGLWKAAEVNGPDIKAENDFGKTTVGVKYREVSASGGRLQLTVSPHSFTMLQGAIQRRS